MSKFRIYQCKTSDPAKPARQSRILIGSYLVLYMVIMIGLNSNLVVRKFNSRGITLALMLLTVVVFLLILIIVMRKRTREIKQIGTLEFTRTMIKKEIGDLTGEYPFDTINKIEVEKHIRALTVFQSTTGYITYIIRIIKKDMTEEMFIVSDRSVGPTKKVTLSDTINTLKKITDLQFAMK
jgi:hypothetical protein